MPKPALRVRNRSKTVRDATARDIMTRDVVTVREDTPVIEAAQTLMQKGVSNAAVTETDFTREVLVGFISEKDILQCYATGKLFSVPEMKVGEIMRPHPVSIRPETDLYTLAAIFMQHDYRHVPVTAGQVLQGMVSRRDVLAALMEDLRGWQFQDPATRTRPDLAAIFTPRFLLG